VNKVSIIEVKRVFITIGKKNIVTVIAIALVAVILISALAVTSTASVFFGKSSRKIPVYGVDTAGEEKVIALTFDAAWGADKTQGIIDIMNENEAKGTFFLVGFWIDKFEAETKAIAKAGFDIGNHSRNHLNMPKLSDGEIRAEIEYVNDKVKELTGTSPTYFRAPFGDYSDRLMSALEEMNMVGVQWSIDSLDWKGLSAKEIYDRVVPKAKSGDIVLFHNNSDHVLDALPMILSALKAQGFRFVTLSELVATEGYTIDNNGIQHKAA